MPDIGDAYIVRAEFVNRAGQPADPSLVLGWVEEPVTDAIVPVVFSNPEIGLYEGRYFITQAGKHNVIVRGSGNNITATDQRSFFVKAPAFIPV